jgi:soluble lytic murein transglycosylase-like protein
VDEPGAQVASPGAPAPQPATPAPAHGGPAACLFFGGPVLILLLLLLVRTVDVVDTPRSVEERVLRFLPAAETAAREEGVDLALLLAMAHTESSGRPRARSPAGAVGLMQIMAPTAGDLTGGEGFDRTDPALSLRYGARYLRQQIDRFGIDPLGRELALAAYNAGPAKVRRWVKERPLDPDATRLGDWVPILETREYVRRVIGREQQYRRLLEARRDAASDG